MVWRWSVKINLKLKYVIDFIICCFWFFFCCVWNRSAFVIFVLSLDLIYILKFIQVFSIIIRNTYISRKNACYARQNWVQKYKYQLAEVTRKVMIILQYNFWLFISFFRIRHDFTLRLILVNLGDNPRYLLFIFGFKTSSGPDFDLSKQLELFILLWLYSSYSLFEILNTTSHNLIATFKGWGPIDSVCPSVCLSSILFQAVSL